MKFDELVYVVIRPRGHFGKLTSYSDKACLWQQSNKHFWEFYLQDDAENQLA